LTPGQEVFGVYPNVTSFTESSGEKGVIFVGTDPQPQICLSSNGMAEANSEKIRRVMDETLSSRLPMKQLSSKRGLHKRVTSHPDVYHRNLGNGSV